jgi:hypothetical protein
MKIRPIQLRVKTAMQSQRHKQTEQTNKQTKFETTVIVVKPNTKNMSPRLTQTSNKKTRNKNESQPTIISHLSAKRHLAS